MSKPELLHIADGIEMLAGLELPPDIVTLTTAVLGIRESGKTNTATVITEELLKIGAQVVVIDPLDVWYGLKSSADGTSAGFPVTILGGPHGDLPLTEHSGRAIGDFAAENPVPLILSLRHLSKGAQRRFVGEFASQFYHRKGEGRYSTPVLVVIDEASSFIPQRVQGDVAYVVGAIEDLVRRGRAAGIGVMLIDQRAASVNKDVLSQLELLVAHRHTSPQDRDALKRWVESHDTDGQGREFLGSLTKLERGRAWFWSPGWLNLFQLVQVRKRSTFDSSATPRAGARPASPTVLAQVDLSALQQRMDDIITEQRQNDPRELRKRIAELQQQVQTKAPAQEVRIETVEVPVIAPDEVAALRELLSNAERFMQEAGRMMAGMQQALFRIQPAGTPPPAPTRREAVAVSPTNAAEPPRRKSTSIPGDISKYGSVLLQTLAERHPMTLTVSQLSLLSGRSQRSSAFGVALAELKQRDYVRVDAHAVVLTPTGAQAAGGVDHAPRDPAAVREQWRKALPAYEVSLFDVLVSTYPRSLTREDLAAQSGRSITSSGFGAAITTLRRQNLIELVDGGSLRVTDTLFGG